MVDIQKKHCSSRSLIALTGFGVEDRPFHWAVQVFMMRACIWGYALMFGEIKND